jgi:NAD(P)-dependent dehydrogenase (short-subunit alcohol dehydrogenase family)
VHCDVSDAASVNAAFTEADSFLGGLDALVHAAGIAPGEPASEVTSEAWDKVMAVNARSTMLTNQAAFHRLKDKGGRIVNFASGAGVMGMVGKASYSASKGAVLSWTRTIAREWGQHRINVNAVCPGISTPMYAKTRSLMTPEQLVEHDAFMAREVPLGGKLGDPDEDFLPVIRFLIGPGSKFMTGQTFQVDGGMVMVR